MSDVEDIKDRLKQLIEQSKDEICAKLNSEFEELIFIRNGEFYVDCSDKGVIDIKLNIK